MSAATLWISCGVLRVELEELLRLKKIDGELLFFDSMLHMDPQKLEKTLTAACAQHGTESKRLVLVYGDCCPRMLDLARRTGVGRVNAINCAQMLVGHARYRELMQEGAFMILPEWAERWQEVFQVELGLTKDVAHDLMQDHCGGLVYLDTGLVPVPRVSLAACSVYTGLPWRVERATLDHLLSALLKAQASAAVDDFK